MDSMDPSRAFVRNVKRLIVKVLYPFKIYICLSSSLLQSLLFIMFVCVFFIIWGALCSIILGVYKHKHKHRTFIDPLVPFPCLNIGITVYCTLFLYIIYFML